MSAEGPIKVTDTSEVAICTCMQSNHWPFCDATHHTTGGGGDGPEIVRLNKKKTYYLCGCFRTCLLYTSPSPRDQRGSRMPSSA